MLIDSIGLQVIIGLLFSLMGLLLGSFSNVLVYRLSEHKSLFKPSRSFCPTCGNEIKWYDNIPILSYIILKGKCRNCKEKISIRYPLIEAAGLVIGISFFLLNYWNPGLTHPGTDVPMGFVCFFNWHTIIYFLMAIILLNIALIDYKTYEIPYELSVPLMLLAIGKYVGDAIIAQDYLLVNILGFVGPLVLFGLIYLIPYLIKKIEVIGLGDVILYSFIGLALGGWNIILIVLISTLVCSIVELIKIKVTGNKTTIAFGPYIAIATVICMVFGDVIVNAYLSLIGLM